MALKMMQRQNATELKSLGYLSFIYSIRKNETNTKKEKMNEVFSILLDYDILLKIKDVECGGHYSPIDEMTQAIKKGTFSKNNKLSKEEFAFSMKMLQNTKMLDDDTKQKLHDILRTEDVSIEIGKREITYLLENKEVLNQITEEFPGLKKSILKQIDIYIYSILDEVSKKQREITFEERNLCSKYFENYFEVSLENNFDTTEMTQLFFLIFDLANPKGINNIRKLKNQEETTDFFRTEFSKNHIWEKFDAKVQEKIKNIKMNQNITIEEFQKYDNIFFEYSYRVKIDDVDNVELIRVLNEQAKKLKIQSRTIENQIERYIDACLRGKGEFENSDFYEILLDYYERQLDGSAVEINNNASISHLIRAAEIGRIPANIATRILEKLAERNLNNPLPEIKDTDNLDIYMQNVAEIRLHQGRMPMRCCQFIIKQAILNQNGIIELFRGVKGLGILQRALEDFTEYQLEKSGLKNYFVAVENQPFLSGNTYNGIQDSDKKRIIISRKSFLVNGIYKMLETALHEHTHAEDDEQIKNGKLNGIRYKMLKESIIRKHKPLFYNDNYPYMFCEINASIKGYMKRIKFLRRWGLSDAQIAELQKDNIQTKVTEYVKACRKGQTKKIGDVRKDVNVIFFELLQENQGLLNEYPALQMEFEVKGKRIQRKSFVNILQEYEYLLNQTESQKEVERISNLYNEILLNGGDVEEERKKDEIERLVAFKSENPIIMAYRDRVMQIRFPRQMTMAATMRYFYERSPIEGKKQASRVVRNLEPKGIKNAHGAGKKMGRRGGENGSTFEM